MVKALSKETEAAIKFAITAGERRTTAEIALVVSPSSDPYQGFLALHGFALGSLFAMALWLYRPALGFPVFFAVQVATLALVMFTPFLKPLFLKLVPTKVMHHRASRRAFEEFLLASRHMPPQVPVVLLYVSLAERYVHTVYSRGVPQKIPGAAFDKITGDFSNAMRTQGLEAACLAAVKDMTVLLEQHFPEVK